MDESVKEQTPKPSNVPATTDKAKDEHHRSRRDKDSSKSSSRATSSKSPPRGSTRSSDKTSSRGSARSSNRTSSRSSSRGSARSSNRALSRSSSRGSARSSNKTSSRDRGREDRDAKQRGRRTPGATSTPGAVSSKGGHRSRDKAAAGASSSITPGAVSSTGEHKSSRKTGRHHRSRSKDSTEAWPDESDRTANTHHSRDRKIDESDRTSNTQQSRDRKKDRNRARAVTPGAVSSNDDSLVSSKRSDGKHSSAKTSSRDRNAKSRNRASKPASTPGAVSSSVDSSQRTKSSAYQQKEEEYNLATGSNNNNAADNQDEPTAVAITVDEETEEEERNKRIQAEREAEARQETFRREMEARQQQEAPPPQRNKNRNIRFAIFCVVVIGAGIVAALFATGTFSPSKIEDTTAASEKEANHTTGSPTVITPVPTDLPSSSPTWFVYERPSKEQCELISQGLEVDGQDEMMEKNFLLQLDVDLSSDMNEPPDLEESLANGLQRVTGPKLAGCDTGVVSSSQGRNLQVNDVFKYIIGNVVVVSVTKDEVSCADSAETICTRIIIEIMLLVKGDELQTYSYLGRFSDAFSAENGGVVSEFGLGPPFVTIRLFSVTTLDPTTAPISIAPSLTPSSRPSSQPTPTPPIAVPPNEDPTVSPVAAASEAPTSGPTKIPTPKPSLRPSIQPAPGATPVPTTSPSKRPSLIPSSSPSVAPSGLPSTIPSAVPSDDPSAAPSGSPSATPSTSLSGVPSGSPSAAPSTSPSASPSKAPSMVPSQAPTTCPAPLSYFGPQLAGYCVKSNGADQNSGVVKVLSGDFGNTQESKDSCLEACSCYDEGTAKGCEMIWGQYNRGCYVHTQEVTRGQGSDLHLCHITCSNTFGAELAGFCVKSNGSDQNSGVVKVLSGDFGNTQESKESCLQACSCYEGTATGCEMIWGQYNRGCYVHTQEVARGQGSDRHLCHIATCTNKFGPQLAGFCVQSNGADQNSGVVKVLSGDFGNTEESKASCLEACTCYEGTATGCEMIWDQSNRGCYVHTQEVARGQGSDRHLCHIAA